MEIILSMHKSPQTRSRVSPSGFSR